MNFDAFNKNKFDGHLQKKCVTSPTSMINMSGEAGTGLLSLYTTFCSNWIKINSSSYLYSNSCIFQTKNKNKNKFQQFTYVQLSSSVCSSMACIYIISKHAIFVKIFKSVMSSDPYTCGQHKLCIKIKKTWLSSPDIRLLGNNRF